MIADLLRQLAAPLTGEELFDHLPRVVYFIKNDRAEYLVVNRTLVERCGQRDKQALVGRTVSEVLRPPHGDRFEEQDRSVLRTGQPIVSRLELHLYASRDLGWCLTTKLPLRNKAGRVAGLTGVSVDLQLPDAGAEGYDRIAQALDYAERRLEAPPAVTELARRAGLSHYQFDRRMKAVFGVTARQWLIKLRIGAAEQMLRDGDTPLSSIAQAVGYADQSAFTRQFARTTGLTPRIYRRVCRAADPA